MTGNTSKKIIVKVLSVVNLPYLLEQSPKGEGIYGDVQFVFDDRKECDYVVIKNRLIEKHDVICDPNNVWAIMMEPPIGGFFDFTLFGHDQYAKVFRTINDNADPKYIKSHIMTYWYMHIDYDTVIDHKVGDKAKMISCVSSNKSFLPGHKKRLNFVKQLIDADLGIDYYGRGINPIENKWDALYPYKFSIAIENSSMPDYWTEKISDCFMAYTIPIYYGCTNIDEYFPAGSFLKIDINDIAGSIKKIKEAISGDYYEKNFNALIEARNLYLTKYHLFPCVADLINKDMQVRKNEINNPRVISLLPYRQPFLRTIYNIIMSQVRKVGRWSGLSQLLNT
jgi:hypothetical protein